MENPIEIDDLGVPLFLETPIWCLAFVPTHPHRKKHWNTGPCHNLIWLTLGLHHHVTLKSFLTSFTESNIYSSVKHQIIKSFTNLQFPEPLASCFCSRNPPNPNTHHVFECMFVFLQWLVRTSFIEQPFRIPSQRMRNGVSNWPMGSGKLTWQWNNPTFNRKYSPEN